ncbi:hypothetical protein VNO77_39124 [Canavalia gladiata]|uniref:Uncharacterized protein n=1 Tax=Canavalia gladiata TaxID=3824 RepID=A0AAN9KBP1_CANGL
MRRRIAELHHILPFSYKNSRWVEGKDLGGEVFGRLQLRRELVARKESRRSLGDYTLVLASRTQEQIVEIHLTQHSATKFPVRILNLFECMHILDKCEEQCNRCVVVRLVVFADNFPFACLLPIKPLVLTHGLVQGEMMCERFGNSSRVFRRVHHTEHRYLKYSYKTGSVISKWNNLSLPTSGKLIAMHADEHVELGTSTESKVAQAWRQFVRCLNLMEAKCPQR